jgi:3',5'-cyclic AMP phosphodiesterase CpdA
VLHLGDFGDDTCQQAAVARGIEASHRRAPFDAGVAAGDLVYECGPEAPPDAAPCTFAQDESAIAPSSTPAPARAFAVHDEPLAFLGDVPVHPALGNHDVGHARRCRMGPDPAATARAKACLAVAHRGPQWVMPGRHYAVDAGPARLIVIDSNVVVADYGGFRLDDEVAFVAAQADGCADRPCFLVGHHPPVSAGAHGRDAAPEYQARMARLLAAGRGRIRAYLAGHDHDLQHLRTPEGLDVFVSGAGSRGRWGADLSQLSVPGAELLFGSERWGHGVLEVGADGWRYRFEDHRAEPVYCCAARGDGPCRPVACGARAP